jgi:hypothetical protein
LSLGTKKKTVVQPAKKEKQKKHNNGQRGQTLNWFRTKGRMHKEGKKCTMVMKANRAGNQGVPRLPMYHSRRSSWRSDRLLAQTRVALGMLPTPGAGVL